MSPTTGTLVKESNEDLLNNLQSPMETVERVFPGVCASCQNAPFCTYPKDAGLQPIQCEDWAGYPAHPSRPVNSAPTLRMKWSPAEGEPRKLRGLCANCEKQGNCTFPKPEEGVWHCIEYF